MLEPPDQVADRFPEAEPISEFTGPYSGRNVCDLLLNTLCTILELCAGTIEQILIGKKRQKNIPFECIISGGYWHITE